MNSSQLAAVEVLLSGGTPAKAFAALANDYQKRHPRVSRAVAWAEAGKTPEGQRILRDMHLPEPQNSNEKRAAVANQEQAGAKTAQVTRIPIKTILALQRSLSIYSVFSSVENLQKLQALLSEALKAAGG